MTKQILGAVFAVGLLMATVPDRALGQEAVDSVSHPIRTNCGVNLDPVGFVLRQSGSLGLGADQVERLGTLATRIAEDNRPMGRRFWQLAGNRDATGERSALLFELRVNYRAALAEMRQILTPEQWAAAFEGESGVRDERVRCLSRAIPVIIGPRS